MIRGIYTAANGLLQASQLQDITAHNLANQLTPGFKRSLPASGVYPWHYLRLGGTSFLMGMGTGSLLDKTALDWSQGTWQEGGSADAAILGEGFFAVEAGGETLYTRAGRFTVGADGYLQVGAGWRVLGPVGPIQVKGAEPLEINSQGEVYAAGARQGLLRVVVPGREAVVEALENGAYRIQGPLQEKTPALLSGYWESSNVDPVREMSQLLLAARAYEGSRQVLKAQDEALQQASRDVGRV
ncbi:MAG: flagellar hook-basal body complex protein [Bacillota bacterium]|nr:flagellar hook-basal body complex protein [Bacillota bacterium]